MIYIIENFKYFGFQKKILTSKLLCRLVSKTNQKNVSLGSFPRSNWIPTKSVIKPKHIIHHIKKIEDSPHFKFLQGNRKPYLDYMNKSGWAAGYGVDHSKKNFTKLINSVKPKFENYPFNKKIRVKKVKDSYIIHDGLHRASIYKHNSKNNYIDVIVLKENKVYNILHFFFKKIKIRIQFLKNSLLFYKFYIYYLKIIFERKNLKDSHENLFMAIIWPHASKHKKKVLETIQNYDSKAKLKLLKKVNIYKVINEIYLFDTAPRKHILNKTLYYINHHNHSNLNIVFFKIKKPKYSLIGTGKYQHKSCNQIRKIKNYLRDELNTNKFYNDTEIHSIHISDIPLEANYFINKNKINYV